MAIKAANNVNARLSEAITAGQTSLRIKNIIGGLPALAAGDWFPITVFTLAGSMEIMRVISVDGSTLGVQRGAEGSTAQAFPVDAILEMRSTAAVIEHLQAESNAAINAAATAQATANGKLDAKGKAVSAGHADTAGTAADPTARDSAAAAQATADGKLPLPVALGGGVDLNTLQTVGFYSQASNADATSGANYPAQVAGTLLVQNTADLGITTQIYIAYNTGLLWVRSRAYKAWSAWRQLASTADKVASAAHADTAGAAPDQTARNAATAAHEAANAAQATANSKLDAGAKAVSAGHADTAGSATDQTARNAAAAAQQTANSKLDPSGKAASAGRADSAARADAAGWADNGVASLTPEVNGAMVAGNDSASLRVRNCVGATGDGGLAMISFHCQHIYALKMGLRADGYFGIGGWSRPAWSWYTDPNGNMYAAGNVTAYSDERLKTDIEVISNALAKIEQVRGVIYTRIDSGVRQTGVIAQELQKVLPEAIEVGCDEEKTLAVAYGNIAGLLIEGIKELNARLQTVEDIVKARSSTCR